MENNGAKLIIGIENLAEALGVKKPTVSQYIRMGMPCNRIGKSFHFHLDNINLWLIAMTSAKYEGQEDPETLEDSENP
jgi:phage terminase Nu1 subunit (DNA packaging protein)